MSTISRRSALTAMASVPAINGPWRASAAPAMLESGEPSSKLLQLISEAKTLEAAHAALADLSEESDCDLEADLDLSYNRWIAAEDRVHGLVPEVPADAKAKAAFALEQLRDDEGAERWVILFLRSLAF
jgi:hypothetical protein